MDINDLITYLLTPLAQIALIMALAEVAKKLGLKTKYVPLLDIGFGLISGVLVYTMYLGYAPVEGVLVGLALGLSACGLFSGTKNLMENKEAKK